MFSNNSDNIQLDKENKNPDDVTIFNESTFANISIITCSIIDQGGLDQKKIQLNLCNIFSI